MSDSDSESTGPGFPSPPTDIEPYAVLSIPRTSTVAEIRTAYRRLALSTHPDKVPPSERDAAHTKFQQLAFAYAVLSDEARRARYDATGSTSESAFGGDGEAFDWKAFFRQQVKDLVSPEAVEKFKKEYQGSEEERLAVLEAYTDSQGSLDVVFERVMVSSVLDDEERFKGIIQAAIDAGEVEAYKAFTKESAKSKKTRRKKAEGEQKEAEEYAKELGVWDVLFGDKKKKMDEVERKVQSGEAEVDGEDDEDGEDGEENDEVEKPKTKGKGKKANGAKAKADPKPRAKKAKKAKKEDDTSALEALIKSRQQNRQADFLSNLEAKYGAGGSEVTKEKAPKKRPGRGKKAVQEEVEDEDMDMPEPTEEEFQAAQSRLRGAAGNKRGGDKVVNGGERRSKRVKTT